MRHRGEKGELLPAVQPAVLPHDRDVGLDNGLSHGAVILVATPMVLTAMHPLVRSGAIESPGVAMVGYGAMTPEGCR